MRKCAPKKTKKCSFAVHQAVFSKPLKTTLSRTCVFARAPRHNKKQGADERRRREREFFARMSTKTNEKVPFCTASGSVFKTLQNEALTNVCFCTRLPAQDETGNTRAPKARARKLCGSQDKSQRKSAFLYHISQRKSASLYHIRQCFQNPPE